jgi:signal transduction histidine kinase
VDEPLGPARLLPLGIACGVLGFTGSGGAAWAVGVGAAGIFLIGGRWPLAVAIGEAVLVVMEHQLMEGTPHVAGTMAGLALCELAIRDPVRRTVIAALVLSAAYYLVIPYDRTFFGVLRVGHDLVAMVAAPMLLGICVRLARQAVVQARARGEERRELAVREARQAERKDIARELHDLIAHHVSSMTLRVGVARAVVPDLDPRVGEVLDDVHRSAKTTLTDLRRLVTVLRDPLSPADDSRSLLLDPADLPAEISAVVERGRQAGLTVDHQLGPAIGTLDSARGLAVLRLVQEGLTNVTKHAGAGARVEVQVECQGDQVVVEVTDDGGALQRPAAPQSGYGLVGLRERVELVGGRLTACPAADGWRLRAVLPLPDREKTR